MGDLKGMSCAKSVTTNGCTRIYTNWMVVATHLLSDFHGSELHVIVFSLLEVVYYVVVVQFVPRITRWRL